jgi:hypothetical protein
MLMMYEDTLKWILEKVSGSLHQSNNIILTVEVI